MARQVINIGSSANDGTGDPLRTAFDKINDNFVELYGSDNDINTLDANLDVNNFEITTGVTNGNIIVTPNGTGSIKLGAMKFVGTTISSDDSTQITIAENIQTTGTLNVGGATTLGSTLTVGTSLALATGATVTGIADEDNMSSNSATLLATQQSIKAYVDAQITAEDLDFQGDSGGALSIDLDSETLTIAGGTGIDTSGSSNTLTVAIDATVATLTGSQTLTNKVLTSPTISSPTITGVTTTTSLTTNDITTNGSNANLTLDPQGSGTIELAAATNVTGNLGISGTTSTADITTTGNTTVSGNSTVAGNLTVQGHINADTIISNSNGDITIDPAGTGAIVLTGPITATGTQTTTGQLNVDNLRLDGNTLSATSGGITLEAATGQNVTVSGTGVKLTANEANFVLMEATTTRTDTLSSDTSDGNLTINTQGTGTIELGANTNLTGALGVSGAITATSLVTNTISSNGSNADLSIQPSGTGDVLISALRVNGTTLDSSDSTKITIAENLDVTGNITGTIDADNATISNLEVDNFKASAIVTEGEGIGSNDNDTTIPTSAAVKDYVDARDIGDLSVTGSTISAPSNAALTLTTSGSGTIELQTDTNLTGTLSVTGNIAKTGDLLVDVSGDIILDADGGDIFLRDGAAGNFGVFIRSGSNDLTIQSGSSQSIIFSGANSALQGDLSVAGSSTLDGVTITDNTIKTNASNADLQIGTSGTGVIDILTATQSTVGSAGGASALPGQPTGYIKIKIGGTLRVIPFYDES
tara:strand:+ start:15984 stop:18272 length:2289 start_codon:yes stop_codon:yes gene_type:complete